MKTIAALIAGLLLSTITFVAGLAIALTLLDIDEPDHTLDSENTAALWSTEPVHINTASQPFERLPACPVAKQIRLAALDTSTATARTEVEDAANTDPAAARPMIDPTTTGAIDARPADDDTARHAQAAHVEWCSRRYRSYNADDNSYRPYGGGRRTCQSPYSDVAEAVPATDRGTITTSEDTPAMVEQAAYDGADTYADSDHIQSCFDRYRSYRPQDNSYQPYDGGPRQQCQ